MYLAYQARIAVKMLEQSIQGLKAQMFSQNAEGWVQLHRDTMINERVAGLKHKILEGGDWEELEKISAEAYLQARFLRLENLLTQTEFNAMGSVEHILRYQISVYAGSPMFQRWWRENSGGSFSLKFVDEVNRILEPET